MSVALFLESVSGIAGDMFAASCLDAGLVTEKELQSIPRLLGLNDVEVRPTKVIRALMQATHINVSWKTDQWKKAFSSQEHGHGSHTHAPHGNVLATGAQKNAHWHTHYSELDQMLERSQLDAHTKKFARKVFRLIAEAEAAAHGMKIEEVAFHEVGAVDSIVDVSMAAYCIAKIAPTKVFATPVKLGRGLIQIEHGTHPVPPPASARLCLGMPTTDVPAAITRENVELSTPTGLAILKALEPEFVRAVPAGIVRAQGMGAGTMDLGSYPNVFRVMTVEVATRANLPYETDSVVEICCNMDDETAERTAWVMEKLLALGALDVWVTPITGKKSRAAVCLSVLSPASGWEKHADWLLRNSSTFGIRHRSWDRLKLVRHFEKREAVTGTVAYKIGSTTSGEKLKEKAEYEDIRKIWDSEQD